MRNSERDEMCDFMDQQEDRPLNARGTIRRLTATIEDLKLRLVELAEGGCHDVIGDEFGNFPCPFKDDALKYRDLCK